MKKMVKLTPTIGYFIGLLSLQSCKSNGPTEPVLDVHKLVFDKLEVHSIPVIKFNHWYNDYGSAIKYDSISYFNDTVNLTYLRTTRFGELRVYDDTMSFHTFADSEGVPYGSYISNTSTNLFSDAKLENDKISWIYFDSDTSIGIKDSIGGVRYGTFFSFEMLNVPFQRKGDTIVASIYGSSIQSIDSLFHDDKYYSDGEQHTGGTYNGNIHDIDVFKIQYPLPDNAYIRVTFHQTR